MLTAACAGNLAWPQSAYLIGSFTLLASCFLPKGKDWGIWLLACTVCRTWQIWLPQFWKAENGMPLQQQRRLAAEPYARPSGPDHRPPCSDNALVLVQNAQQVWGIAWKQPASSIWIVRLETYLNNMHKGNPARVCQLLFDLCNLMLAGDCIPWCIPLHCGSQSCWQMTVLGVVVILPLYRIDLILFHDLP